MVDEDTRGLRRQFLLRPCQQGATRFNLLWSESAAQATRPHRNLMRLCIPAAHQLQGGDLSPTRSSIGTASAVANARQAATLPGFLRLSISLRYPAGIDAAAASARCVMPRFSRQIRTGLSPSS